MLLSSCSMFTKTRDRDRDRRDDRDDDDDRPSFTRPVRETSETTAGTTATAVTVETTMEITPTPSDGSLTDDDYVAAYTSYLTILEDNEDEIRAYDWMVSEEYSDYWDDSVMQPLDDCPVALADVTGDSLYDLFIMKTDNDYMATLEIYSYDPSSGSTNLIFTEDGFDLLAGGGGRYLIATMEDGFLFIYDAIGDEDWHDNYTVYYYNRAAVAMEPTGVLSYHEYLNDDATGYEYEYFLNDESISEEDFIFYKCDALEYLQYVLQFNFITDQDIIEYTGGCYRAALSYDEAYCLLEEVLSGFTT